MSGIPMEVIEHKLRIDSSFKPIKQKERRYTPDRHEAIRQEVSWFMTMNLYEVAHMSGNRWMLQHPTIKSV
jgi:hypothetical protein